MKYKLEVKKQAHEEWMEWRVGSLDEVLSDFFHWQGRAVAALRIIWERDQT